MALNTVSGRLSLSAGSAGDRRPRALVLVIANGLAVAFGG